jgi:protein TonB
MKPRTAMLQSVCIFALATLAACADSPAPPPAAPPTTQAQYNQDVLDAVAQSTREPPSIASSGATGVVHIAIILDPTGQLVSADIAQSSGTVGLDNYALEAIDNTQFPKLPASVPQQDQGFDLPIDYRPPHAN